MNNKFDSPRCRAVAAGELAKGLAKLVTWRQPRMLSGSGVGLAGMALACFGLGLSSPAQPSNLHSALLFGGRQNVSIATTGSLTGTFTVELWANPTDPTADLGLLGSRVQWWQPYFTTEHGFDLKLMSGNLIHADGTMSTPWAGLGTSAATCESPVRLIPPATEI